VVAAQNVLLENQEITTDSLDRYIQMFKDGLSEEQAHLIADLFTEQAAAAALPEDDECAFPLGVAGREWCLMAVEGILVWNVRGLNA
jgi:hypothetical protein